jgi:hypothetical protein
VGINSNSISATSTGNSVISRISINN